ncbi:MAG TPA: hypothetical protein VGX76_00630 [Pirellulales bacterium]|jgi:hypothetical protein|nr:hypothetical protein [Pirellulales bacterium]
MTQVTVPEAQQQLRELLAAAEAGESVVIQGENGRNFTVSVQPQAPAVNPKWPGVSTWNEPVAR